MDRVKAKYPDVHYVGIADGAKGELGVLGRHTDVQVVDFWHAVEYLGKAAVVLFEATPRPGSRGWTMRAIDWNTIRVGRRGC